MNYTMVVDRLLISLCDLCGLLCGFVRRLPFAEEYIHRRSQRSQRGILNLRHACDLTRQLRHRHTQSLAPAGATHVFLILSPGSASLHSGLRAISPFRAKNGTRGECHSGEEIVRNPP